ncbi:MAG: PAS domain-containing protein, partial [Gammaproteobacteria bacterium]
VHQKIAEAVDEKKPYSIEYRIVTAARESRWVYERGKAEYDEIGLPHLLHATIIDISERKETEQKLQESLDNAKHFREALDQVSSHIFIKDKNLRYLYANQAVLDTLNVSRRVLINQNDSPFFDPERVKEIREVDEQVLAGNRMETYRVDNSVSPAKHYKVIKTPIYEYGGTGKVAGLLGISTDITAAKQTEEELRRSKELVEGIFDNTDALIVVKDRAGTFLLGNRRWYETVAEVHDINTSDVELIGKSVYDLYPKDIADEIQKIDNQVLESKEKIAFETHYDVDSSSTKTWMATKFPLMDVDGNAYAVGTISFDITDQKAAEAELRRSKALVDGVFDNTDALIFVKDRSGVYVLGNRCWAESVTELGNSNFSPDEIVGKTVYQLYPHDQAQRFDALDNQVFEDKQPRSFEYSSDLDPKQRTWLGTKFPLIDADGYAYAVATVGFDITATKQAEAELRRSQKLVQTVFDNAGAQIVAKDRDGVYLLGNEAWAEFVRFLGMPEFTLEGAIGKTPYDFYEKELADKFLEGDKLVFESGENQSFEFTSPRDSLQRVWMDTKFPLFDLEGEIYAVATVVFDVTELKRVESQLREAQDAANAANRAKSDFLANMSHEIRTPMNGIMGMTELALDTEITREQREYLQTIESSAESLLTLIDDILDFSKIEAEKLELDPIDFDLRDRLGETLSTLAARAHAKNLELAFDVDTEVPDVLIGDVHRLRQIIVNLVGNALKFTEQGEIVVRVGVDSMSDDEVITHVSVSDTGVGIPADRLEKIFESFEQADTSTTRTYGGTGLGLAICSRLAELMGGRIWVESKEGLGSSFHFTVKFGKSTQRKDLRSESSIKNLGGLRVLVVDDNQTNRQILEKMLENWQMSPTVAENGYIGLDKFREKLTDEAPFDIVISDVNMPKMDGFDFVDALNKAAPSAQPPVILLSSSRRSGDAERSRQLGIKANLLKPAKQSQILDAIIDSVGVETLSAKHDSRQSESQTENTSAASLHILIAEDNEVNQKFAVRALNKAGHTSKIANNGQEAIEALAKESFDLILMDVQMPVMDGYAATAAIRKQQSKDSKHITIIALTAHAMKGDREKCVAAGMNGYVTKPIKRKTLMAEIGRVIGSQHDSG